MAASKAPKMRPRGEMHSMSKLTEAKVVSLRNDAADGMSGPALAKKYGVSVSTTSAVVHRRLWAYLPKSEKEIAAEGRLAARKDYRDRIMGWSRAEVLDIRTSAIRGESSASLAERYKTSTGHILSVIRCDVYRNVPDPRQVLIEEKAMRRSTSFPLLYVTPDGDVYKNGLTRRSISPDSWGYLQLVHGRRTIKVHRLVAEVFCEGWFDGAQVNHKDGNKLNNHYTNLEWCSAKENIRHAHALGLRPNHANRRKAVRPTDEQVKEIRALFASGVNKSRLSKQFNIGRMSIRCIVTGKTYKETAK